MTHHDTPTPDAIAEAEQERWWRYRCGEPNLERYPVRCRRDLNHPTPHVGLGHEPAVWPGTGNTASAKVGENYRCWGYCAAHRVG